MAEALVGQERPGKRLKDFESSRLPETLSDLMLDKLILTEAARRNL
jgi:hypothetical protein